MAGFYDNLDQLIAKHGGEDEAYRHKLKNTLRETLGYSNYMSKRSAAMKQPLDLSAMEGNITPAGVKSIVGSAMDIKKQGIETYGEMASKVDTAADQLAAAQIAREKAASAAARSKIGIENGVAFSPQNALEKSVLEFMQNPKNPDGSVKSLQQFEAEQNAFYNNPANMPGSAKDPTPRRVHSPEEIKQVLEERIPTDYIGNEDKYFMMSQGYSEKQSLANAGALRYTEMTDAEKLIFETQSPGMATALQEKKGVDRLLNDATQTQTIKDPETGAESTIPKYTFTQLKERYPSMTPAEVEQYAIAPYRKAITEDIEFYLKEVAGKKPKKFMGMDWLAKDTEDMTKMDVMRSIYNKEDPAYKAGGIEDVKSTNIYKEMKAQLTGFYGGTFTPSEIEIFLFNNIMERV